MELYCNSNIITIFAEAKQSDDLIIPKSNGQCSHILVGLFLCPD